MASEAKKYAHEDAGVRTQKVLAFVLIFVIFAVALVAALGLYYRAFVGPRTTLEPQQTFPAPRLQPNPGLDYKAFHMAQLAELAGQRWVDRHRNLIHVPIDRAMAFIVSRGKDAYEPLESPAPATKASVVIGPHAGAASHDPGAASHGAQQQ